MFQVTIQLKSPSGEYGLEQYKGDIRDALVGEGLNPEGCLLRGGFYRVRDLDLLLRKGTDYRDGPTNPPSFRSVPDSLFAAPVDYIGHDVWGKDPLCKAFSSKNNISALAVFDANELKLVREWWMEYVFVHPDQKLQALLGVLHIEFESAPG